MMWIFIKVNIQKMLSNRIINFDSSFFIFVLQYKRTCSYGGIGRRDRLKIYFSQESVGSSPTTSTIKVKNGEPKEVRFLYKYEI